GWDSCKPRRPRLQRAGDAAQSARDGETQSTQCDETRDRDEGEQKTVLGQSLTVFALEPRNERHQSLVDLGEHCLLLSCPFDSLFIDCRLVARKNLVHVCLCLRRIIITFW